MKGNKDKKQYNVIYTLSWNIKHLNKSNVELCLFAPRGGDKNGVR